MHEVARGAASEVRVVSADIDPVAVAHSRAMLAGDDTATAIRADLRAPADILENAEVRRLIDFAEPVALILAAVLQFIPDEDDPWRLVARVRDPLPPGSYLILSHISREEVTGPVADAMAKAYRGQVDARASYRSRAAVERFFGGFDLVAPGLVPPPEWRPDGPVADGDPARGWFLAGVGRKS